MQMLTHIGLFYFVKEVKLFISVILVLNIFLIKKSVGSKNIKANIFRVEANNSIMYGYFCIGFIDFMLVGKELTDFTSLFSPLDFKRNESYFKDE